ncbi:MAG: beta-RFAP synthase [Planctomycetota bacterium]
MSRVIEVRTPGRLHFGLSSFGGAGRQFSGVGLMVDGSGVTLRLSCADSFRARGLHSQRVQKFADHLAREQQLTQLPRCAIEVTSSPPNHVGLGIGTQLGMAVAAALLQYQGTSWRDPQLLRRLSGRGRRSAIGTYGFVHGGLLVDRGKLPHETLGELAERVDVPTEWRFVLIRQPTAEGLCGNAESAAISSLPPVPASITAELQSIVAHRLLPAVADHNFEAFSAAVYDYGYQAGECFASAQGGPFASSEIARLVEEVRSLGFAGTGQSSWGPTVFAVTPDQQTAEELVEALRDQGPYDTCDFAITQGNNTGAIVEETSLDACGQPD